MLRLTRWLIALAILSFLVMCLQLWVVIVAEKINVSNKTITTSQETIILKQEELIRISEYVVGFIKERQDVQSNNIFLSPTKQQAMPEKVIFKNPITEGNVPVIVNDVMGQVTVGSETPEGVKEVDKNR